MTITFLNTKGGCGKTSLLYATGITLASQGMQVLMIDLDPQGSLSHLCGKQRAADDPSRGTACDLYNDGTPKVINVANGLTIIPAHEDLKQGASLPGRALQAGVERVRDRCEADYILIDTPGNRDNLYRGAALVADRLIIPVRPSAVDLVELRICFDDLDTMDIRSDYRIIGNGFTRQDADRYLPKIQEIVLEKLGTEMDGEFGEVWDKIYYRIPPMRSIASMQGWAPGATRFTGRAKEYIAEMARRIVYAG